MKLYPHTEGRDAAAGKAGSRWVVAQREAHGVALVITLLMLSVITFLAIAFLAMSQRNQSAVSASLDLATAHSMSDAAQARAQAEIMAQMLAQGDPLYYDYTVSRNYISSYLFRTGVADTTNVNYDSFLTNGKQAGYTLSGPDWAQNIANLWYDPRPPVFVVTNPVYPTNLDFRFWVDINRNGRFETNGYQPIVADNGFRTGLYESLNGEPEFIGVLRNPLFHHSASNQFIGRYAYMVLPIGKTLDLNYIHNFLKSTYENSITPFNNSNTPTANPTEGFARDQGIGSWELNLAAMLDAVSPWAYENPTNLTLSYGPYSYIPPNPISYNTGGGNTGNAFYDAEAILHYRYWPVPYVVPSLKQAQPGNYADYYPNLVDIYCKASPLTAPFDYNGTNVFQKEDDTQPWPGSYGSNMFFDVQDLFDPVKTSSYFTNRMIQASQQTNTYDRYTFQRLLSCIGVGSSPEYGVWVYDDKGNQTLRTKVNINYDNTAQITNANAPYAAMPTNLVWWTPLGFFTNAAELLLRSQNFGYTNYITVTNAAGFLTNVVNEAQPAIFAHFGVTNIPIYRTNLPGIRYDASMHRMLQLAANIYDATVWSNYQSAVYPPQRTNPPPYRQPSVFRPRFGLVTTNGYGINIIGYVQVTNSLVAYNQLIQHPFLDMPAALNDLIARGTNAADDNIWGIPWVVGANKGIPQFYQYSFQNNVLYERKLQFIRKANADGTPDTNHPPQYTNQFYCMAISNRFGMDAWNPYPTPFTGSSAGNGVTWYISNYITIQVTNNYKFFFPTNLTNYYQTYTVGNGGFWRPWGLTGNPLTDTNGFITFFPTNVLTLPACYFSEYSNQFVFFTNNIINSNQFSALDSRQQGWPVHNWTVNITNHVVYAMFDGISSAGVPGALLDFVNLQPFGISINVQQAVMTNSVQSGLTIGNSPGSNPWLFGNANDSPTSPMSQGLLNQIASNPNYNANYTNNLNGLQGNGSLPHDAGFVFGPPVEPTYVVSQVANWVANDPIVHYTVDDLILPANLASGVNVVSDPTQAPILTNNLGRINPMRYAPWGYGDKTTAANMLYKDPNLNNSSAWSFPTNKFPSVGWIGRVHRGTPWQTVYLKADNPDSTPDATNVWISSWVNSPWFNPEPSPETYPTNDWSLVDLFTTAPNDNAARGLLSVNQFNDAAWAAVFGGVIAPTNEYGGIQITPNGSVSNYANLMDTAYGINSWRTNYPNGIFHKVGDILGAAALTTASPFLLVNSGNLTDELAERIPQQTLSLLKVGEPQFVIFSWGQTLKPKGPPYLGGGANNNIYTNYEITGEVLTRTVCHLVHTNGLKMVIDSYNVESGN